MGRIMTFRERSGSWCIDGWSVYLFMELYLTANILEGIDSVSARRSADTEGEIPYSVGFHQDVSCIHDEPEYV